MHDDHPTIGARMHLPLVNNPIVADIDSEPPSLAHSIQSSPTSSADYIGYLLREILPHTKHVWSPRNLGHMANFIPLELIPVATISLALNQNMVKRDASGVMVKLELDCIEQLHRLTFGLASAFYDLHRGREASSLGLFTSGGTLSNITALWVARNRTFGATEDCKGAEIAGLPEALHTRGQRRGLIVGSSLMHYSIEKAASVLGLGADACIKVPVDGSGRVEAARVREVVRSSRAAGDEIVAIVGVAGSTDCGSIDPLADLAEVARDSGVHFHVDGAWGAPLLFSHKYSALLAGISTADSVTIDAHKQMHLPLGSSLVLFRDPNAAAVIEKQAAYMLRHGSGDLGRRSLEGSRPSAALVLHAALKIFGCRGYADWIEASMARTRFMSAEIDRSACFERLHDPQTNILLYRYIVPAWRGQSAAGRLSGSQNEHLNALNRWLQHRQSEADEFHVSRTTVERRTSGAPAPTVALRAVLSNPLTTEQDILALLEDQEQIGSAYPAMAGAS